MDQAEEELKKKLIELEKKTFDPVLGGRQEEIWARMSGVRERAHILEKETERLGNSLSSQQDTQVFSEADLQSLDEVSFTHANGLGFMLTQFRFSGSMISSFRT